jgi:5-methylcytosine-specific restriction protein B
MTDNLERSVLEADSHPWAFDRTRSQMRGILPNGTYVVFLRATLPSGATLGRQGPIGLDTRVTRIVLGRITEGIHETESPYFAGFPFEFRYELIDDAELVAESTLADAAAEICQRIDGLELTQEHLREVLSNARSSKVGMFYEGMPRTAPYFKGFEEIPTLTPTPPLSGPEESTERTAQPEQPADPFGMASQGFSDAVAAAGLIFDGMNRDLPLALFAAVAAKRFAILTGMSGSGKTQIARALGQWFGRTPNDVARYRVVAVRADWTSPEPMLGYEDALAPPAPDGRRAWYVPDTLRFILDAAADPTHPWLLVLDEMNLAHVERYFADVLSGIESGEPVIPDLVHQNGYWYPRSSTAMSIPLPTNLVIIGTVNVDETTYQFSPKVLDRAFSFEFRVATEELASGRRWPVAAPAGDDAHLAALLSVMTDPDWHDHHRHPAHDEINDGLLELHRNLGPISLEFGHRTFREALRFAATLAATGVSDPDLGWDWIVMTKILPRVHGGRRQLESFLTELNRFAVGADADKPPRPLVERKTARMLRSLQTTQFASFSE